MTYNYKHFLRKWTDSRFWEPWMNIEHLFRKIFAPTKIIVDVLCPLWRKIESFIQKWNEKEFNLVILFELR